MACFVVYVGMFVYKIDYEMQHENLLIAYGDSIRVLDKNITCILADVSTPKDVYSSHTSMIVSLNMLVKARNRCVQTYNIELAACYPDSLSPHKVVRLWELPLNRTR